jgi:hypothetical protein
VTTERSRHLQSEPSRRFAPLSLGDPRAHPASPVGHAVDQATAQPPPTTIPSQRLRWPSTGLRQLRAPGSALGRRRAGRGHGRQPNRPWPSQPCRRLPTAALHDLIPVGHRGRGNARTADARTGHRTSVTWTLDARTGHWTLDAGRGRDRVTTAPPASGPPRLTSRVTALGRPTVFLWTAPAALGSPCRLGVRPPPSPRLPLALPRSSSVVAPPAPSGASAHCSPQTITGRA